MWQHPLQLRAARRSRRRVAALRQRAVVRAIIIIYEHSFWKFYSHIGVMHSAMAWLVFKARSELKEASMFWKKKWHFVRGREGVYPCQTGR